jgi:hypothetical protein
MARIGRHPVRSVMMRIELPVAAMSSMCHCCGVGSTRSTRLLTSPCSSMARRMMSLVPMSASTIGAINGPWRASLGAC